LIFLLQQSKVGLNRPDVVVVVWENLPVSPGVFMLESIAASLAVELTEKESE